MAPRSQKHQDRDGAAPSRRGKHSTRRSTPHPLQSSPPSSSFQADDYLPEPEPLSDDHLPRGTSDQYSNGFPGPSDYESTGYLTYSGSSAYAGSSSYPAPPGTQPYIPYASSCSYAAAPGSDYGSTTHPLANSYTPSTDSAYTSQYDHESTGYNSMGNGNLDSALDTFPLDDFSYNRESSNASAITTQDAYSMSAVSTMAVSRASSYSTPAIPSSSVTQSSSPSMTGSNPTARDTHGPQPSYYIATFDSKQSMTKVEEKPPKKLEEGKGKEIWENYGMACDEHKRQKKR